MRKAKIVCTIGPASDSAPLLERLIEAGMDAARINLSHGSHESHSRAIAAIREAAHRRRAAVAIILDLQGPRIRVGELPGDGIDVENDQPLCLEAGPLSGTSSSVVGIPVTYPNLARDVKPGARILIDDGAIELVVKEVSGGSVLCTVVTGGHISSHKGINLPGASISAQALTGKDREDIKFGIAQGVDYLALSFVRGPEDVVEAKQLVAQLGGDVPVIAKIERHEAISRLEGLVKEADGIMIARGDLGVEMGPEAVPILQKKIIQEANRRRRLVITATQMLESMTQSRRPTRAEASDVANAIFDGTDAVMLSAETAVGKFPWESVRVMDQIIRAAEETTEPGVRRRAKTRRGPVSSQEATCAAAASAAAATDSSSIITFTESGATAQFIAEQRPVAPIIAFTPFEAVRQRMALYWGVIPHTMPPVEQTDDRIREAERRLKAEGLAVPGQRVVFLSGTQVGQRGGTNFIKLHDVT